MSGPLLLDNFYEEKEIPDQNKFKSPHAIIITNLSSQRNN